MKSKTSRLRAKALPPPVLAILSVIRGNADIDDGEMNVALAAVREHLRTNAGYYPDAVHDYIRRYAETGPYHEGVERAHKLDPGNIEGDIHNAYATPGLLAGIALAYVVLTNDGGAR